MTNSFAIPQIHAEKNFVPPADNIPTIMTVTSFGDNATILLIEDTLTVPVNTPPRVLSVSVSQ